MRRRILRYESPPFLLSSDLSVLVTQIESHLSQLVTQVVIAVLLRNGREGADREGRTRIVVLKFRARLETYERFAHHHPRFRRPGPQESHPAEDVYDP